MAVIKPKSNPIEGAYELCDQTVTVYHCDATGTITRTVYTKAFLDDRKNRNVERTGTTDANAFLLVIPGSSASVAVGDKVLRGEGPTIATEGEWRSFIPAKVDGLVVVKYVDAKRWSGEIVHVEAGG